MAIGPAEQSLEAIPKTYSFVQLKLNRYSRVYSGLDRQGMIRIYTWLRASIRIVASKYSYGWLASIRTLSFTGEQTPIEISVSVRIIHKSSRSYRIDDWFLIGYPFHLPVPWFFSAAWSNWTGLYWLSFSMTVVIFWLMKLQIPGTWRFSAIVV